MPASRGPVSVAVPSYGRAALLPLTIPSYLQDVCGELIVVDDCSPDATERAVAALAAADPRVRYIRSERNLKQTHAKNLGIKAARFPLIFFGDDDSLLLPGSLERLLKTMQESGADIVGASAPYMETEEDAADPIAFAARRPRLTGPLVEPATLHCHFDAAADGYLDAPFVHAAFLCRTELAARVGFDEGYDGNCYREETDFLIRARAAGAKIVYEPRAVQANLPRSMAGGGAHGSGSFVLRKLRYFHQAARNNARFLKKNGRELNKALGLRLPAWLRHALFLADVAGVIVSYPLRKAARGGR